MSVLLGFHENDKDNDHLQKAIDEWQKVFDENEMRCQGKFLRHLLHNNATTSYPSRIIDETRTQDKIHLHLKDETPNKLNTTNKKMLRGLKDETPFGRGGWDPFHPTLVRTSKFDFQLTK